jgi:hypothetical protein
MMPYGRCWSSPQLTGHADFWHPTGVTDFAASEFAQGKTRERTRSLLKAVIAGT